jgi:hypothetical protein
MKTVSESRTVIITYFGGRLPHNDKITAEQMRSRRRWKDFNSAKRAYGMASFAEPGAKGQPPGDQPGGPDLLSFTGMFYPASGRPERSPEPSLVARSPVAVANAGGAVLGPRHEVSDP